MSVCSRWRLSSVFLLLAMFPGCGDTDRYQLTQDSKGRTIRLDKKTGDILVFDGDRLIKPVTPEEEAKANLALSQKKDWGTKDIPQLDGLKVSLSTTWIGGKLHYQFAVSPGKTVQKARNVSDSLSTRGFAILLYDAGGFKLVEISVPLNSMSGTVNKTGELLSYDGNDSVNCSVDTYQRLDHWNVQWNFRLGSS